ncbi:FG-GAP-like repeat-containing protein [Polaribacter porphyrae]|uniref:LamG-like jellyroll fold domain-containing protein n=1 Tax=Polaribacter porphyrae TaxID=1137780 RepID=A0A2S7WTS7_9FLAO|nr:FG-GAP-like repeat-containing protein [Polaribacter porphyrae]PQJ80732.1 hypothetical protein BTO18_16830 [Polaribacter porphyrae]
MKKTKLLFALLLICSLPIFSQVSFIEVTTPFDDVDDSSVAFADIDGDGDKDVLITGKNNSFSEITRLYTNDGNGNFALVNGTPFDNVTSSSVAFADIDGDNDQDVLISGNNGSTQISKLYKNDGTGNFTLVTGTPFDGVLLGSIAFADVDGDNDQDVLITGHDSSSSKISKLYTNNGSGTFTLVSGTPFDGASDSSVAFADIDGDNDQDVLITGNNGSSFESKLYTNNGSGTFTLVSGTPFVNIRKGSVAFTDIDGDNDQDLLITGQSNGFGRNTELYKNNGSGSFTLVTGVPFDRVDNSSVAFADVDGDNDQDVLITGLVGSSAISKLYINDGNGDFTLVTGTPFDGVNRGSIAFEDINGDNKQDVLITGNNNSFSKTSKLYKNTTSYAPTTITTAATSITQNTVLIGGDITKNNGLTVTERGIVYSTTDQTPEIGETGVIKDTNGAGLGMYSKTISGLNSETIYYYRAYSINSDGIGYGNVMAFATLGLSISSISRLNPTAQDLYDTSATYQIIFSKPVKDVDVSDFITNSLGVTINSVTAISNTTYNVALTNITTSGDVLLQTKGVAGVTGSNDITTLAGPAQTTTVDQQSKDDYLNQSTLGQTFTASTFGSIKSVTFYLEPGQHTFSGTADLKLYSGVSNNGGTEIDSESVTITSSTDSAGQTFTFSTPMTLSAGITHTITLENFSGSGSHALSSNRNGGYNGGHIIFSGMNNSSHLDFDLKIKIIEEETTIGDIALSTVAPITNEKYIKRSKTPETATVDATIVNNTNITLNGDISFQGLSTVTERGFLYSTTDTNPKIGDTDVTRDINGAGTGVFSKTFSGLTPNTTYFYRAYAINTQGVGYGEVKKVFFNHALHFDKSNDYITIPDNAAFDFSNGFSIEAWVRVTSFSGNPVIFSQYASNQKAFATIVKTDGSIENTISTDGSSDTYYTTANKITPHIWQHVAFTYDGTTMKFYINGTEAGIDGSVTGSTGTVFNSTAPIELGARNGSLFYGGDMDEVRIWTKTLTNTEINNQKDSRIDPSTANLVAYYNFNNGVLFGDNTSITEIKDVTSNNLVGTLNGFNRIGATSNFVEGVTSGSFGTNGIKTNFFNTTGNWSAASNWSLGTVPTQIEKAIISSGNTVTIDVDDLVIDDFTLENNATLSIPADKEITIQNEFSTSGNLELLSDKNNSGVLFLDGTTSGNVTYTRGGLLANEWYIITPPVSGQTIKSFAENVSNDIRTNTSVSPTRYAIATYDDSKATGTRWVYFDANVNATDTFTAGQSYSMSRATNGGVSFTGTLTVNDLNKTLTAGAWNAIGNPFTTYYPANKNSSTSFLNDNLSKLDINFPSLYIWDDTQNKYVAVTELDATARSLPPGQGFFIKMKAGETEILFNEEKRTLKPATGTTDFSKTETTPNITLTVTQGKTAVHTSIKFFDNTTAGFDAGYDIGNFDSGSLDIYSHLVDNSNTNNYTIQSLSNSNFDGVVIPISINAKKGDQITLSGVFTNIPSEINVYLEDRNTNSFTELTATSQKEIVIENEGATKDRFYIHLSQKALNTNTTLLTDVALYSNHKTVFIHNIKEAGTFTLHSMLGSQVYQQKVSVSAKTEIPLKDLSIGIYLATLKTNSGTITKKIILE